MQKIRLLSVLVFGLLAMPACQKTLPSALDDSELLDRPMEGLSNEENRRFLSGDRAFNDHIFSAVSGLGPLFVATSCGGCHAGDGKGHPSTALIRFGQPDETGNQFLHSGGPQLQHRSLPGFEPEQIPVGATFTTLLPPANTGLGLLEFVPDLDVLALADPEDLDGDGISGRPNWIALPGYTEEAPNAQSQNGLYIGRFGKKAAVYNLLQQTARAYNQDMGITSLYEPYDTYSSYEIDPEVSNQTVLDVVFYLRTLKAPIQREPDAKNVQTGKALFTEIGCAKCHTPTLHTGASPIEALSFREFHPYTDLLLHDMGSDLDDHYSEGSAQTAEWRTPPLWGLGLSRNSQGGQYYLLHDGRAQSIESAILLHGGEGNQSRSAFQALDAAQKKQLITFLESL